MRHRGAPGAGELLHRDANHVFDDEVLDACIHRNIEAFEIALKKSKRSLLIKEATGIGEQAMVKSSQEKNRRLELAQLLAAAKNDDVPTFAFGTTDPAM